MLTDPLFWTSLATGLLAWRLRLAHVPHLLATMGLLLWAAWRALSGDHVAADKPVGWALWTLSTAAVLYAVEVARPTRASDRWAVDPSPAARWAARVARRVLVALAGALAAAARALAARADKLHEAARGTPRMDPVERVESDGTLFAIIVRAAYREPGVNFVTPPESQFQVGVLSHPLGRVIKAHVHKTRPQQVTGTPEVLVVREGKVRTDFYHPDGRYVASKTLAAGDTILLMDGGHGFEVLEPCVMIEVKQGPYRGVAEDKRLLDDKPSG